jgi:RNA polymerase sigma-70 factor (ECF subfamily)
MSQADDERFQRLYRSHLDAVTAYARRRVGTDAVEDVVAETFLVCWRRLERVPDEPLPWLYAVARKTIANHRRKNARAAVQASADTVAEPVLGGDRMLAAAFAALRERDREVLRLVAWEGLTAAEAASALGCSSVACRVRYHRAKTRLAQRLAQLDSSPAVLPQRSDLKGVTR